MLKVWEILTSAVTSGRPQDQHTEGVENRGKSYKKESHNLCLVPSSKPRPQALSSKTEGGESLVTSARKAVDFRHVIIHVINAHFSSNCHVI